MDHVRIGINRAFSSATYQQLAAQLGLLEVECATLEAQAYRKIRASMDQQQIAKMMAIRADYIIDTKNTESLSGIARGAQLYKFCAGCHETPNLAPSLTGILNRPIGSMQFNYSSALKSQQHNRWDNKTLDTFIAGPDKAIPGNKMGFSGLLNASDRQDLIQYITTPLTLNDQESKQQSD
ncbi:c-type cytochrome [Algibacillus agarilyticus]|uniref:c-type cytochrome n=1 Tax=Algibacillus agarilyticus TaxID=2234133 RepID=UPI000DD04B87|nr:c-type cytochrome [Algibacillus agarilyticus]